LIDRIASIATAELTVKSLLLQDVTNAIVGKLHHHPLSLANVGISISRSHASDPDYWNMIEEELQSYLDAIDISDARPFLFDSPYSLSIRASMMVMVKRLSPEVFPLPGVMALFNHPCFPEDLVKLFYRRISQSNIQFAGYMKYLESRSLIEMWKQEKTDEFMVSLGSQRTHYIRETRKVDMRALALFVLGVTQGGEDSMKSTDEDILTTVIAAIEFAEPFLREVAFSLENLLRTNNDGEVPRVLGNPSFLGIARAIRSHREFRLLYRFLNFSGEIGWKQQAHQYSRKVMGTDKHELCN
jgi:hypothetical protein